MKIQWVYFIVDDMIRLSLDIRVARKMIASHPYNSWPLHVKLFTRDAVKGWQDANKAVGDSTPLPKGFTVTTELEGVDGKSGELGSGRKGPIEVTDSLLPRILILALL
jgi:structure-specific endonuclease subunit SLX1